MLNPISIWKGTALYKSLSQYYLNGDEHLVKCLVPNEELLAKLKTNGSDLRYIDCENRYYIVEIRVRERYDSLGPYYILKNWNKSGFNIDATVNDAHLTFFIKETVPKELAMSKITKTLEDNLEKMTNMSNSSINEKTNHHDNDELAHKSMVKSSPLLKPRKPQFKTQQDLFPEALLVNEINNDPRLTFVLFKSLHENYISSKKLRKWFLAHDFTKVRLSYVFPKEIWNSFIGNNLHNLQFDESLMDKLIFLLKSERSRTSNTLGKIQDPGCLNVFERHLPNKLWKTEYDNKFRKKQVVQSILSNKFLVVKKPDVLVFSEAFLEELPSYTEMSMTNSKISTIFKNIV